MPLRRVGITYSRLLLAWIVLFTAAVVFALVSLRNVTNDNRRLGREGQEAHAGLCALKADLVRRTEASRKLLFEHKGEPVIFAIPRSVIESSVANQQRTVDALKDLDCS